MMCISAHAYHNERTKAMSKKQNTIDSLNELTSKFRTGLGFTDVFGKLHEAMEHFAEIGKSIAPFNKVDRLVTPAMKQITDYAESMRRALGPWANLGILHTNQYETSETYDIEVIDGEPLENIMSKINEKLEYKFESWNNEPYKYSKIVLKLEK